MPHRHPAQHRPRSPRPARAPHGGPQPAQRYWRALVASDRAAALSAVKELHDRDVAAADVLADLVVPAQQRLEELWLDGHLSRDQVERLTAINEGMVHWLTSFDPDPGADLPLVVVAVVPGERYVLPALVLGQALLEAGFRVLQVAADAGPDVLGAAVRRRHATAVCLVGDDPAGLAHVPALVAAVRRARVPALLVGRAAGARPDRARALGVLAAVPDADGALDLLAPRPGVDPGRLATDVQAASGAGSRVEAEWLAEYAGEIVPYLVRALAAAHLAGGPLPAWWTEVPDAVARLLDALAAALVSDDAEVLTEVTTEIDRMLVARGAPDGLVEHAVVLLREPLQGHPMARTVLARGAAHLTA